MAPARERGLSTSTTARCACRTAWRPTAEVTQRRSWRWPRAASEVLEAGPGVQVGRARGQGAEVGRGDRGPGAAAAARPDRARRARGLLHHQGPGLPLRRGAHDRGPAAEPGRRPMKLENDTGRGHDLQLRRATMTPLRSTPASTCSTATCSRSRRGRSQIRVTSAAPAASATGNVSDWLADVDAADGQPDYKWDFVHEYKHPQQLYARFEEIAQQNPDIAEIVTLPNKTNGYQRKAQATIGGDRPGRGRHQLGGLGPRGRQRDHRRVRQPPGTDLPLAVEVNGKAITRAAGHERHRRARRARRPRSRRRSRRSRRA